MQTFSNILKMWHAEAKHVIDTPSGVKLSPPRGFARANRKLHALDRF